MPPGTRYFIEVNPRVPKRLARLEEPAQNLWYSWDRPTRALFAKLNPPLWDAVGHSPKAMLKRIDEQRLIDAATDPAFLEDTKKRNLPVNPVAWQVQQKLAQQILATPDATVARLKAILGL